MIFGVSILETDWRRGKQVPWVSSHFQFAKPSVGYRLLCKHSDRSLKWLLAAHNANILQLLVKFSSCPLPAYHTFTYVMMNLCALSCNRGHCDCNCFIPSFNSRYSVHKMYILTVCVHFTSYTRARFHLTEQQITENNGHYSPTTVVPAGC